MGNARMLATRQPDATPQAYARKRVILSMGGKGGVGKTNVMGGLAEWFATNRIPVTLLDLDTENKGGVLSPTSLTGGCPK